MAKIKIEKHMVVECTESSAHSFYLAGHSYHARQEGGKWYIDDKYGVEHVAYPNNTGIGLYIPCEVQHANGAIPSKITFERV